MFVWNRYEVSRKFCLWARELPFDFVVFHINRELDDFFFRQKDTNGSVALL